MHAGTKTATMIAFFKLHKRAMGWLLVFAWVALPIVRERSLAPMSIGINMFFVASQLFWLRRAGDLGRKLITNRSWRRGLAVVGLTAYAILLILTLFTGDEAINSSSLTLRAALQEGPFKVWLFGSLLGLLLIIPLWMADRMARAARWTFRKLIVPQRPQLPSSSRRRFLEQTTTAFCAAPFVAGAYGLFYGRLNLETIQKRIMLRRLPKAFEGLRIVQLSDIHISAFMSAEEIRRYAAIANQLKPDLIVLTGDFVTWEGAAQGAVVDALSGLKAPFGVFGCLGNHEWMTETESSITRLFAARGTRILRGENVAVKSGGSTLNLLGVDYQALEGRLEAPGHSVDHYLPAVERLLVPDTVNILLSHNPNTFDRAAELGIDLSLSGHTHGGQLALELPHTCLAPVRLITPYIRGWFQDRDAQLYVNRGIGTLTFPMRLGARPEITVFELVRSA
jgi:uncharacterized protein